jgi:hypothetical protein
MEELCQFCRSKYAKYLACNLPVTAVIFNVENACLRQGGEPLQCWMQEYKTKVEETSSVSQKAYA